MSGSQFTVPLICQRCGTSFEVKRSRAARGQVKFCSRPCYAASQVGRSKYQPVIRVVVDGKLPCSACGAVLPTTEFRRDSTRASGYHSYCKPCVSSKVKAKRQEDPEWAAQQVGRTKRWQALNPARARLHLRASTRKRRALKRTTQVQPIGAAHIEALYARQQGRCWWCGEPLSGAFDLDHIYPLVRGGTHTLDNLCCACDSCNSRKQARTPQEFAGRLF